MEEVGGGGLVVPATRVAARPRPWPAHRSGRARTQLFRATADGSRRRRWWPISLREKPPLVTGVDRLW
jgi:hypothetical protein